MIAASIVPETSGDICIGSFWQLVQTLRRQQVADPDADGEARVGACGEHVDRKGDGEARQAGVD